MNDFQTAAVSRNPAWVQLLGLCPLLAVSNTITNALGLAIASTFVVIGSNVLIAAIRHQIPDFARLPVFVLVIATFTTLTTLALEAYAYDLYLKIALFIQIIVTNCMILGRAETFASRQPIRRTLRDASGTGLGFSLALLILGSTRELVGRGTLFADMHLLLGESARSWEIEFGPALMPLASYAPGAFIVAGLLLALGKHCFAGGAPNTDTPDQTIDILDLTRDTRPD